MSHETVDRYVDSITASYQTALREHLATLAEPNVLEVERACRRVDYMIETLAAFAIGHAVSRVTEALRRIDHGLEAPMAAALATIHVPALPAALLPPARYLGDAHARPLVDYLGATLHHRLGLAARHAKLLLRAIADVASRYPHAFTHALERLTADPAAAFAFTDQLALGWQFTIAVITGAADPVLPDEPRWRRGRALWTAWSRRVRGARPAGEREYIVRVA